MAKKKKKSAKRSSSNSFNAKAMLDRFVKDANAVTAPYYSMKFDDIASSSEILALSPRQLAEIAMLALGRNWKTQREHYGLYLLGDRLYRRKLPYNSDEIESVCKRIATEAGKYGPVSGTLLTMVERYSAANDLSEKSLEHLRLAIDRCPANNTEVRKVQQRLRKMVGAEREPNLKPGEAWSDAAIEELSKIRGKKKQAAWKELLAHGQDSDGAKPKKPWTDAASKLIKQIGPDDFCERTVCWFSLVDKPRTETVEGVSEWGPDPNQMLDPTNAAILKGLVWCCSLVNNGEVVRAITPLAMTAYKKVPGIGPRAVSLGNACVYTLGTVEGTEGVAQLAILKVRVKFGTAQKGIEKALVATAEREGIPRDELEEMSVPAYGLMDVGERTELLGEFTARLCIASRKPMLQWFKPDGKQQKTVPKAVKDDFGDELKELKQAAKDIEKMLPAQAARIEQTYLDQREWELPVWRERYLDHPLVGILARRLIWSFQRGRNRASAIWTEDGLVDSRNKSINWPDDSTKVTLWHPLAEKSVARTTAWRDWLLEHEVQQPFKQAHREVYILTDAERNTGVYSNRFAAHVLKQHQFNALCGARGWKNTLRLLVDDEFPPAHIMLPSWELRAEFWVEGAGDEYGTDTNETGTFYYLTTDQVRFYRADAATNWAHAAGGGYGSATTDREQHQPLNLDQIPPLVFSEVMRDVDLFVGVASVGNDPNWADGGPEGRHRDYWHSFSFGDLNATAGTRKAVLERLIPRLKIADRCSFSERFLIVKGDIRTYHIHLGSGNILMEPNDEYLCIVPKQSTTKSGDVFLPFEGDNTMSIILSKALMLADDTKIKDATIISQIKPR